MQELCCCFFNTGLKVQLQHVIKFYTTVINMMLFVTLMDSCKHTFLDELKDMKLAKTASERTSYAKKARNF